MQKHRIRKWITGSIIFLLALIALEKIHYSGGLPASVPVWLIIRLMGMTAFLLLSIGLCLGILLGMPIWEGRASSHHTLMSFHFYLNTFGVFFAMLHPLIAIADSYAPFQWYQLFVPFAAPDQPFYYGLGTLAIYGYLVVLITTDLKRNIPIKFWHGFHLLSYFLFVVMLAHGMLSGTDTRNPLIFLIYVLIFLIVLILMFIQIFLVSAHRRAVRKRVSDNKNIHPLS